MDNVGVASLLGLEMSEDNSKVRHQPHCWVLGWLWLRLQRRITELVSFLFCSFLHFILWGRVSGSLNRPQPHHITKDDLDPDLDLLPPSRCWASRPKPWRRTEFTNSHTWIICWTQEEQQEKNIPPPGYSSSIKQKGQFKAQGDRKANTASIAVSLPLFSLNGAWRYAQLLGTWVVWLVQDTQIINSMPFSYWGQQRGHWTKGDDKQTTGGHRLPLLSWG